MPDPNGAGAAAVQVAAHDTIQAHAKQKPESADLFMTALFNTTQFVRGSVVRDWPSNYRDNDLRAFWRQEGNDILAGTITTFSRRVAAFDWTVKSADNDMERPRLVQMSSDMLQYADIGLGWTPFVEKLAQDYLSTDKGAFIEIIGPGRDKRKPLTYATGLAHLDSIRCHLTGYREYPVAYCDTDGIWHALHRTRVSRIADSPSPYIEHRGWGFCSVSRVILYSHLMQLIGKYKREKIDDGPAAGILALNNVTKLQFDQFIESVNLDRRAEGYEVFKGVVALTNFDPTMPISVQLTEFANADWFDQESEFRTYVNIVALAFGVDPQDIWPLSGGSLGTATQSEVLHQKARGKGIRHFIKQLERVINQHVISHKLSFEFDARDIEEEKSHAERDSMVISNFESLQRMGVMDASQVGRKLVELQIIDAEDLLPSEGIETTGDDVSAEAAEVSPNPEKEIETSEPDKSEGPGMEETTNTGKAFWDATRRWLADFAAGVVALPQGTATKATELSATYLDELINLLQQAVYAGLPQQRYINEFRATIDRYFPRAFLAGLRAGGWNVESLDDPELADEERQRLAFEQGREREFVNSGIAVDLYGALPAIPRTSAEGRDVVFARFAQRLQMWAVKLDGIFELGKLAARGNKLLGWQLGPTEHCESCKAAALQVHRASTWLRAGIVVKSKNLECGGWRCQCEWDENVTQSRGDIRTIPLFKPSAGFWTAGGNLAQNFFRDVFGRGLRDREV